MKRSVHVLIIRSVALLFVAGAVIHWLIILGYMREDAPWLLTAYFHSLSVLNLFTAFGLWTWRRWGVWLGLCIALTQVASHGWMLLFYPFEAWRVLDIVFALFFTYYFTRAHVLRMFPGNS